MTREEFDSLTDQETDEIIKAWERRLDRENAMFARVCWSVFKASPKRKQGGDWQVSDFVPKKPVSAEVKAKMLHAQAVVFAARQRSAEKLKNKNGKR